MNVNLRGTVLVAQATKTMACELVDYGIRVNDAAPGLAVTEFHFAQAPDPAARKRELEELRAGLLSHAASGAAPRSRRGYRVPGQRGRLVVTGTTLCIDGGRVGLDTRSPAPR